MTSLAPTLQTFFTDRLIRQRHASPNTIAAYRDTFKLLLGFATAAPANQLHSWISPTWDPRRSPRSSTTCKTERGNSVTTRNARLAAVRSLFRFAALRHPEHAALIQRVLAIPPSAAIAA